MDCTTQATPRILLHNEKIRSHQGIAVDKGPELDFSRRARSRSLREALMGAKIFSRRRARFCVLLLPYRKHQNAARFLSGRAHAYRGYCILNLV
eukprot:SAG11_NODE_1662_length_4497_cov_2.281492_5_plen_94_part_00